MTIDNLTDRLDFLLWSRSTRCLFRDNVWHILDRGHRGQFESTVVLLNRNSSEGQAADCCWYDSIINCVGANGREVRAGRCRGSWFPASSRHLRPGVKVWSEDAKL